MCTQMSDHVTILAISNVEVDTMAYNETSYKAANKYKRENIKRVPLDMQKSDYEDLKAAADAKGEKVNEYIKTAIRERMERDRLIANEAGDGFGIWEAPSNEDIRKLLDLPHTPDEN